MNRTLLLIALAAVAAAGIAAGLLHTPGDGAAAPPTPAPDGREPTTISLALADDAPSSQVAVLGGVLLDGDGAPVGNRPVEVWWRDAGDGPEWRAWYANPMARTLADGSFSISLRPRSPDGSTSVYRVRFPGDPWFAPAESQGVTVVSPPVR